MTSLAATFGDIGQILGVCPCCDSLFYLPEAHPYLVGRRPRSQLDRLRAEEMRLEYQEEKLAELEDDLRKKAREAGNKSAKKLLKKIDLVFSGAGYDPQDVKVIFNPVTYVVFHGLTKDRVDEVILLGHEPRDSLAERIQKSLSATIKDGNVEFRTIRVDNEGQVNHS